MHTFYCQVGKIDYSEVGNEVLTTLNGRLAERLFVRSKFKSHFDVILLLLHSNSLFLQYVYKMWKDLI